MFLSFSSRVLVPLTNHNNPLKHIDLRDEEEEEDYGEEEGSEEEYSGDEQGSEEEQNGNETVGLTPQQEEILQIVSLNC